MFDERHTLTDEPARRCLSALPEAEALDSLAPRGPASPTQ